MASRRKKKDERKLTEKDISGLKYFHQLDSLLSQLHDVGCERDTAGNRTLHMDQYCLLVLSYLFNPIVSSLRAVQQASELKNVQKKLGCARASLGSLSESVSVFDAERLKPIIEGLSEQLKPLAADQRLKDVKGLTLVDGSIVEALPRIAMASFPKAQAGSGEKMKWTLHTHFEVDRSVPTRIDVTPTAGGEHDERAVMARTVESDRTYVMDRGYAKFELFNRIVDVGSSYGATGPAKLTLWSNVEQRGQPNLLDGGSMIAIIPSVKSSRYSRSQSMSGDPNHGTRESS